MDTFLKDILQDTGWYIDISTLDIDEKMAVYNMLKEAYGRAPLPDKVWYYTNTRDDGEMTDEVFWTNDPRWSNPAASKIVPKFSTTVRVWGFNILTPPNKLRIEELRNKIKQYQEELNRLLGS